MTPLKPVRILFWIAAIYDAVLGLAFLIAGHAIFDRLELTPPNHLGYVQFSSAVLLIFALMFAAIAVRPVANRHLIFYGLLLKVAYCAVVAMHWYGGGVPWIWKPFVVIDAVFAILFVWAWRTLADAARARLVESAAS